jgi:hypothetical protein
MIGVCRRIISGTSSPIGIAARPVTEISGKKEVKYDPFLTTIPDDPVSAAAQ